MDDLHEDLLEASPKEATSQPSEDLPAGAEAAWTLLIGLVDILETKGDLFSRLVYGVKLLFVLMVWK